MRHLLFILLSFNIFGAEFDCAIVGTSPVPLFEAIFRHHCGQKVLILEAGKECGGAWKSIDICGVAHADMGCHEISSSLELNKFLEEYGGCSMISSNSNYYFSKGCFELVNNLLKRIHAAGIPLYTECRVDSVRLDTENNQGILNTDRGVFTATKIIVTPGSSFDIEGHHSQARWANKFYHLYLLLEDASPPRFSYHSGMTSGVSRMMNLTSFVGIGPTGKQLIVLQTYSDQIFENASNVVEDLKRHNLIDQEASLLKAESYIYEQGPYFPRGQLDTNEQSFFEVLNTSHFNVIGTYAPKWKKVMPPYIEGLP